MSNSFASMLSQSSHAGNADVISLSKMAIQDNARENYTLRVTNAADTTQIIAQEDIVSDRGVKLVAAGSAINGSMRDRLLQHKLNKPLENTIIIGNADVVQRLADHAERILSERTDLLPLIGWRHSSVSTVDILAQLRPNRATLSALALIEQSEGFGLAHSALVALIALGIGKQLNLGFKEITDLAMAAVFHDIGQLYVAPELFNFGKKLPPAQWKHIAVHPIVGARIARDTLGLNDAICRAILESHERIDGSGYPSRTSNINLSKLGKILSFAEQISGIAARPNTGLARLVVAVKVVPYEHQREVLSGFLRPLSGQISTQNIPIAPSFNDDLHQFFVRIANTLTVLAHLEAEPGLDQNFSRVLEKCKQRFDTVQRSFSSTGLDMAANNQDWINDLNATLGGVEAQVALDEMLWRLSELARDLHLRCENFTQHQMQLFEPLIAALDGAMTRSMDVGLNQSIELF